jgi:hypothetical protein
MEFFYAKLYVQETASICNIPANITEVLTRFLPEFDHYLAVYTFSTLQ